MLLNKEQKNYAHDMMIEYTQCFDEGKDVAQFKAECQKISEEFESEQAFEQAVLLREKLLNAPMRKDFAYVEPSSLEEIRKEKRGKRKAFLLLMKSN